MTSGQHAGLAQLRRLAQAHGIQPAYTDLSGQRVDSPPASLEAVLRALGVVETLRDVPEALARFDEAAWLWKIEPVTVAWDGWLPALRLCLPQSERAGTALCSLELESGETRQWTVSLEEADVAETGQSGGVACVALELPLAKALPWGYHRLTLEVRGRELHTLLIAAPRQVYRPAADRRWGVFLPLYALFSRRSWGIGDYTDLRALLRWAGSKGARFVGTLPLLSTFLDKPYDHSPYAPVSRLFWNEVYVDPEAPFTASMRQPLNGLQAEAESARRLTALPRVAYRDVMAIKRRALQQQAEAANSDPETAAALQRFVAEKPEVHDYAMFRAALEQLGPDWRGWPRRAHEGRLEAGDYAADVAAYYRFAQWRADTQMRELAQESRERDVRLYLDLPVGVHAGGYDAWRHQGLFAQGVSVGAPPDLLAPEGQNWGFQPLKPRALRESGYAYTIAYLRHHLSAAGMLRIDHAIGLHRLFWIPEGASGRDGVFVQQPAEELYALLSLESHRHAAVIAAEDLGLAPPEVDAGLREHGISGMYVQMFEMTGDEQSPLKPPVPGCVAGFGTHDLPPFAAYWQDEDLALRERLGLLTADDAKQQVAQRERLRLALVRHLQSRGALGEAYSTAEVYRAVTGLLADSDAGWLVVNLEETWGEVRSQNIPGTTSEQYASWTSRSAHGLEEFDSLSELLQALRLVASDRRSGR